MTDEQSFANIRKWYRGAMENTSNNLSFVVVEIAKKSNDKENRAIAIEKGQDFAQEIGAKFITCCIETEDNIDAVFGVAAQQIYDKVTGTCATSSQADDNVSLSPRSSYEKSLSNNSKQFQAVQEKHTQLQKEHAELKKNYHSLQEQNAKLQQQLIDMRQESRSASAPQQSQNWDGNFNTFFTGPAAPGDSVQERGTDFAPNPGSSCD